MKIQSLAIIFIIIIMPITMVLSQYVDNKITTSITELEYDTRLLNSTYDAIKAYQINTINNAYGDVTNSKINDIEAAATTFYNSLASNFNYTGYKSLVMKEYVPAIAFTMYDGYYIHSPFINTLTEVKDGPGDDKDYDTSYSVNGEIQEGLKPYVYYTCRYQRQNGTYTDDFSITYTLDNYITIQGTINNQYIYDYGYLCSGIEKKTFGSEVYYTYNMIEFKEDQNTEQLKEYVGNTQYSYVKINGKKYYLEEGTQGNKIDGINENAKIFFIDDSGKKNYSQVKNKTYKQTIASNDSVDIDNFKKLYNAITKNKSAYEYYKNAYEFTRAVLGKVPLGEEYYDKAGTKVTGGGYGLGVGENGLKYNNVVVNNDQYGTTSIVTDVNKDMYIFDNSKDLEYSDSNFNQHRKAVIRYVVETNLSAAIKGFSSKAVSEFIMPKISETDWEIIENDVCAISFMQGMSIGAKRYNGYSVVANTLTKEHIDENDIYILTKDNTYHTANDTTITSVENNIKGDNNGKVDGYYYAGIWKINFEQKRDISSGNSIYYIPLRDYLGSYTSIMGNQGLKDSSIGISTNIDMYRYIKSCGYTAQKRVYYYALGRERWGAFNINNINYELHGNNGTEYFLNDY